MSPADIAAASARLEREPPEEALRWAAQRFAGRVGFATAFGPEGCVLLEAIAREKLAIDVFTLDTGLLFPETLELWRELERRYGVRVRGVKPALTVAEQELSHGPALWQHAPDLCCDLRKVQPLRIEMRSEEHTSELQSLAYLVCRLLLEKKKKRMSRQSN